MISVSRLEKSYGSIHAVKGIDFQVAAGEIVGLLGHNGAGKTTVMKMITGFLEPTAGTVTVGGVDVLEDPLGVQAQIGYLPENAPLYPEMLVQEYLLMIAALRGLAPAEQERRVVEAVTATGLSDRLLQPISTLSKGYRQRVGLAQAIVHRPKVLILDEPTSGLDPVQIVEIRELIRRLAEHSTIILSTHILQEVEAVCDRAIILIDGELAADAAMTDLLTGRTVIASVEDGASDVEQRLSGLEAVSRVQRVGPDPELAGFTRYRIDTTERTAGLPVVGQAVADAGWVVAALQPETASLESVFNRLLEEHVSRAAGRPGPEAETGTGNRSDKEEVAA